MSNARDLTVVAEIKKRYGRTIDLDKSPMAIIEIIHNFRYLLDHVAGPDGTGGGPPGGPAPAPAPAPAPDPGPDGGGGGGGGPPGSQPVEVGNATVLNLLLELKRDVAALNAKVSRAR